MASRRQDTATTTAGAVGVGTGAAMRHDALEAAYEHAKKPRPKIWQERQFARAPKGRGRFLAGAALMTAALPPGVSGVNGLIRGKHTDKPKPINRGQGVKGKTFIQEAQTGVASSLRQRKKTLSNPAPARHQAQSYAVGTAIGSAAGSAAHLGLRAAKGVPGSAKAAAAAITTLGVGAASLPAQDKIMRHTSHGEYRVTASGVARTKQRPVNPSARATRVDNSRPHPFGKRAGDYPGSDLSRGQKRAVVMAAGTTPIIGDFTAAAAAGSMAPPNLRKKTAGYQLGGSLGGQAVGATAGAYGGAALVRNNKTLRDGAKKVNQFADGVKTAIKKPFLGDKPVHPKVGPGKVASAINRMSISTTPGIARAGRLAARARKPLVGVGLPGAVLGGAIGASAGSTTASTISYGRALDLEDKQRVKRVAKAQTSRHGSRVSKIDAVTGMSRREEHKQLDRRRNAAVISATSAATGLGGAGLLIAGSLSKNPKIKGNLVRAAANTAVASGGLGGVVGIRNAVLTNRDIKGRRKILNTVPEKESASKALSISGPRPFRAKAVRTGYLRQTRSAAGIKTSSVRGGI